MFCLSLYQIKQLCQKVCLNYVPCPLSYYLGNVFNFSNLFEPFLLIVTEFIEFTLLSQRIKLVKLMCLSHSWPHALLDLPMSFLQKKDTTLHIFYFSSLVVYSQNYMWPASDLITDWPEMISFSVVTNVLLEI